MVTFRRGNLQVMVVKLLGSWVGKGGICELGLLLEYLGDGLGLHNHR